MKVILFMPTAINTIANKAIEDFTLANLPEELSTLAPMVIKDYFISKIEQVICKDETKTAIAVINTSVHQWCFDNSYTQDDNIDVLQEILDSYFYPDSSETTGSVFGMSLCKVLESPKETLEYYIDSLSAAFESMLLSLEDTYSAKYIFTDLNDILETVNESTVTVKANNIQIGNNCMVIDVDKFEE